MIRYQGSQSIDLDQPDNLPSVELMVTVDSSLNLDKVVGELEKLGYPVHWDYAEDLSSQYLQLPSPPGKEDIQQLSDILIPNLYEITLHSIEWQDGYRGFVQFIVLFMLSDLKKGGLPDEI